MNLREPLAIPADRPLDVLIHTRYSTDEQSQSSIDGQISACQRFLATSLPRDHKPEQVNVEIIREPEISGEIADRPGINQVWAAINSGDRHGARPRAVLRPYRREAKAGHRGDLRADGQ